MRYDLVLGVLLVLFLGIGIAQMIRLVKGVLVWYKQLWQAEIRANIAASEIQKMLAARGRPLAGGGKLRHATGQHLSCNRDYVKRFNVPMRSLHS